MPQAFRVTVVSLCWHLQAIECFSERLLPVPLWFKQCKDIHHVNLFPFRTGHLPSLKQPRPLPARTLQPRCSGMFFRWAGIQRPDSQKLAIHANRVQELKENNGVIIGFYLSGIAMNKFWFCLSSFLMKYVWSAGVTWTWWCYSGVVVIKVHFCNLGGLSFFLLPYRFALEEMPCVALCVGATVKQSESAWPSPIFQLTNSTRPQKWQAHKHVVFVTKTDWWPVGSYRFSNGFICLIVLSGMGQAFANKVMNQRLKILSLLPQVLKCSSNSQSSTAFR